MMQTFSMTFCQAMVTGGTWFSHWHLLLYQAGMRSRNDENKRQSEADTDLLFPSRFQHYLPRLQSSHFRIIVFSLCHRHPQTLNYRARVSISRDWYVSVSRPDKKKTLYFHQLQVLIGTVSPMRVLFAIYVWYVAV